jgi:hypothetical protein
MLGQQLVHPRQVVGAGLDVGHFPSPARFRVTPVTSVTTILRSDPPIVDETTNVARWGCGYGVAWQAITGVADVTLGRTERINHLLPSLPGQSIENFKWS